MQQYVHRHYCDKCIYLGSTDTEDFYFCGGTMVVRYGSEDPEYLSTPVGYVPDYGPTDNLSDYGRLSLARYQLANALHRYHQARNP